MSEQSRIRFQQYYHTILRERGWMTEAGEELWPEADEARALVARELFGLSLIFDGDSSFYHVKEQIAATELSAAPQLKRALETLKELSSEQKAAVLTLVDDVLDFAIFKFTKQLDRFDHGFLSLRFQNRDDEECEPLSETEVEINPLGIYEMFQDAVRWKREFSMGTRIGRPEDPKDLKG